MRQPDWRWRLGVLLTTCAIGVGAHAQGRRGAPPPPPQLPPSAPAGQSPQVFRSAVNLVPVDVRVVDREGKPVTDLRQSEFVVLENNFRQQIRHFSTSALQPIEGVKAAPLVRTEDAAPIGEQNRRVFLIVLGRGRLQAPGKGVDAALELVKSRLLPQDYVGVLAWNRATDFTTDHAKVLTMLERFKKGHERIEGLLRQHFSGLAAVYGGRDIPAAIQKDIDTVFRGPEAAAVRELPAQAPANASRMAGDSRRITDALQTQAIAATSEMTRLTSISETTDTLGLNMDLDEFVEINAQSMQDITNLYTGINYLRHIGGEKQLLFVSERGVFAPRAEDDRSIAAAASDARVVLNILHTGGTDPRGMAFDWRGPTSRTIADLSGGQYTSTEMGPKFIDRVDETSRFSYTLGYYPTNSVMDGRYRRILVRVTRPGLRVLYRHGYFARQFQSGFDRARMITYSRVTSAATFDREVKDLPVTAEVTTTKTPDGAHSLAVRIQIATERLALTAAGDRKKGAIDVAVFVANDRQQLVGTSWETIEFEMTPEAHQRFLEKGLTYTGRVTATAVPRHVKVVVYDAASDLVGSAMIKLK